MVSVATCVSLLVLVLATATAYLYMLTWLAPSVPSEQEDMKLQLQFPSSVQQLQELAQVLQLYYHTHPLYVLVLFSSAYLYKQAFIIPGSALLNVLAGALFGAWLGFPLCCLLTAAGASSCYLLSRYLASGLVQRLCPQRVASLQQLVESNSHQLVYFLLFLRLFPMTPNWLINLASPIVNVPLHLFFFTVLVGLMPYNFLCVQAGEMLASLTSLDSLFQPRTALQLAGLAAVALLPSLLVRRPLHVKLARTIN